MAKVRSTYKPAEVEEFGRRVRRFHESLAQKERRMLRDIIAASMADDDDVSGFANLSDEDLIALLLKMMSSEEEAVGA